MTGISAFCKSKGILKCTHPNLPLKAVSNASTMDADALSTVSTQMTFFDKNLVTSVESYFLLYMLSSCLTPQPSLSKGVLPDIYRSGIESILADAKPLTQFVTPGPPIEITTESPFFAFPKPVAT